MVLLSEQVRLIADEQSFSVSGLPFEQGPVIDWGTKGSKEITLTKKSIIYLKMSYSIYAYTGAYYIGGGIRALIGSVPCLVYSGIYQASGGTTTGSVEGYMILDVGTYTFNFQISVFVTNSTNNYLRITDITLAAFNFSDKFEYNLDSGLISCPATTLTTLVDQSFTPPARKLAVGTISKYVIFITAVMEREAQRVSKVTYGGVEANFFNWRLYIDDVEVSFSLSKNDYNSGSTDNPTYAEGAYGLSYSKVITSGASHNVKVKCYNGFASAYNGRAVVRIVICPWIIPNNEYIPVSLDFSFGSTLYMMLEPLTTNPTKYIKIGKVRGISFGDTTDYYSSASGTNILSYNYTFEILPPGNMIMLISGYGGCISVLGVDVRQV